MRSLAAEGALLAKDASAGKTTGTFTRVHASDLHQTASKTASTLQTAKSEPAVEPKLRRLAMLARSVSDDLDRLRNASRSEQRRLATELDRAAERSNGISESLK